MSIEAALSDFYKLHGFGDVFGERPKTVKVFTGCLLVPMPNIETRNRYLKYHDLHHLVNEYSVGRIGEGQTSAWELGTGSMRVSPILGIMNLIALSTGWVLDRDKMWAAYERGLKSRNLYARSMREAVDAARWTTIDELRDEISNCRPENALNGFRRGLFRFYVALSLVIHASIAFPALVARIVSELRYGRSLVQALRPQPRNDLY